MLVGTVIRSIILKYASNQGQNMTIIAADVIAWDAIYSFLNSLAYGGTSK